MAGLVVSLFEMSIHPGHLSSTPGVSMCLFAVIFPAKCEDEDKRPAFFTGSADNHSKEYY